MAGPQPNFELMAQAFQGLATKVPKIFDALSACFNAVTTQNGHLTAQVDSLTTQVGALNDTVTAQGRRLDAFDNNNTHAVDQNQHIVDGSSPFHQLHDPVTNVPIPDFPGTCDAIEDLTIPQLDTILETLRVPIDGHKPAKIEAFKNKIGNKF